MKMKKIVVSMFVAGVMASPLAQATDGYFSHGYGIKSKGMGGVGIALPQDALAAATNPAGMVKVGDRIDLGIDWFRPTRDTQIVGNGAGLNGSYDGNAKQNFFVPEFGYNKMLNADSAFGVSVYGNGGMNTDYAVSPFKAFGVTGSTGINLEQLFIAPTYSVNLSPAHSIGISLNLAYQRFSAKGLAPFQGMSSNPAFVTDNGTDSSTGVGVHLGWIGELSPTVSVGATWQPKTKMSKFSKYQGLFADQGSFDIPGSYGVGIAVKATPETTIAADLETIEYGKVPSIANTNATGAPLGAANGAGFGWKNVTIFKVGVSHAWSDSLVLRAGYNHTDQPIPTSQTFFNVLAPGVVQDHVTLGATWLLENKNELSVSYMHAFKQSVNGVNSIAPGMGGGNANIKMYQDSLGIAYSWKM